MPGKVKVVKVLNILGGVTKDFFPEKDIKEIILKYCTDHGKDLQLSEKFYNIASNSNIFNEITRTALTHYSTKYEIIKIINLYTNKTIKYY